VGTGACALEKYEMLLRRIAAPSREIFGAGKIENENAL